MDNLKVGQSVTVSVGSDEYAGEVISRSASGKTIEVKYGFNGRQTRFFRWCPKPRAFYTEAGVYISDTTQAATKLDPSF